ncbi:MAG TPA: laminin B domain-containing protein, partial [Tepidisphaeraceae bacterium]|nr:laminin B domain-containing protein [Tepidisphaeraceae bacterium]
MHKSWIVASVVALMGMQARGVVVSSTFDTGGEGWGVVTYGATDYTGTPTGYGAMPWISSGGNPGGYVRQTDPDGGDTFTIAPASFLGNAVRAYGTTLTYDLFDTGGNEYNAAAAVVLRGAGLTVCYTPATLPSTVAGTFTHFEIPLTETGWAMNGYGGAAVTAGQMQAVLGSLTMVGIRLEYHTGPDDSGLDNVVLPVLPSG